ncbi:MAG: hypothetical protein ACI8VT_000970, partial [Saprospiraceae bacterium]
MTPVFTPHSSFFTPSHPWLAVWVNISLISCLILSARLLEVTS